MLRRRAIAHNFSYTDLEVRGAGRQDHLVSLGALSVAGNCHVREGLLVPEVLE